MELKDVILSTIAELGEEVQKMHEQECGKDEAPIREDDEKIHRIESEAESGNIKEQKCAPEDELQFLQNMRERLLVLFEGFQSPNNKRVEAKIDLTLNFLEYMLALLDERIKRLEKS